MIWLARSQDQWCASSHQYTVSTLPYTVVSTVEFLKYFVTPNPQAQGIVFPFQPKQQLCYVIELGRTPKKYMGRIRRH